MSRITAVIFCISFVFALSAANTKSTPSKKNNKDDEKIVTVMLKNLTEIVCIIKEQDPKTYTLETENGSMILSKNKVELVTEGGTFSQTAASGSDDKKDSSAGGGSSVAEDRADEARKKMKAALKAAAQFRKAITKKVGGIKGYTPSSKNSQNGKNRTGNFTDKYKPFQIDTTKKNKKNNTKQNNNSTAPAHTPTTTNPQNAFSKLPEEYKKYLNRP